MAGERWITEDSNGRIGISRKIYLEMDAPTEEDCRSSQKRILDALSGRLPEGETVEVTLPVLRKLYPLCDQSDWKVTVSFVWNGFCWEIIDIERGNTEECHFGLAIDLGSTTVVGRLINCNTGEIVAEKSAFNRQIHYGMDILSRIFYSKDQPEHLEEIRKDTVQSLIEVIGNLEEESGIDRRNYLQLVIAGNTTMIHFLIGMDAFCVFSTPYAVRADAPGFVRAKDLDLPLNGYVYIYPGKSNYLGGDIISGMIATGLYRQDEISAFFDIGTNGELVIGNREFLLCGAGAAGPALEGAVVRTGMRADAGAVDHVSIHNGKFENHVIGEGKAEGICGSGIVDIIAQLFLEGWIDLRGKLNPEKSELIRMRKVKLAKEFKDEDTEEVEMLCVEYEPGLYFWQDDIDEFVRTKAAAYTMVEIMLEQAGIDAEHLSKFYVCGAFGKHVSKDSAITIGMYPDMDKEHIVNAGNSSLDGAQVLLTERKYLADIDHILDMMTYIQYGSVDRFLEIMEAATFIPHINMSNYPSVEKKLAKRQQLR